MENRSCPEYPELKIRIKELAYEAQVNRKEAQQHTGPQRHSLNLHRKIVIRRAARCAQLAYAYCRGRARKTTEQTPDSFPNFIEIGRLIRKYGGPGREEVREHTVFKWFEDGIEPLPRKETDHDVTTITEMIDARRPQDREKEPQARQERQVLPGISQQPHTRAAQGGQDQAPPEALPP